MTISVTELKARLLEIVREVERHGQVVARIIPARLPSNVSARPWEALHGSGTLLVAPEESVLADEDFEASR